MLPQSCLVQDMNSHFVIATDSLVVREAFIFHTLPLHMPDFFKLILTVEIHRCTDTLQVCTFAGCHTSIMIICSF